MQDDPLRQRQAGVYNRARRRLSWADSAASLVVLVGIVHWADRLGGWGCVLALAVVLPLISLPFEYAGEVLSRRNGLSRQTTGGWLADQAKARAIGLVLGGLIALGLLGLGRLWPNWWPVPAWGGAMVVSVALSVLFKEMRLLHMGEKTSAANAMVAGLGPTLRVYVGDTIAEGEDAEEGLTDTRLVLAHELGHHAHGDVWRLLGITALTLAAGIAGAPDISRRCRRWCSASRLAGRWWRRWERPTRARWSGALTPMRSTSPARASATRSRSSGWSTRT